MKICNRCAIPKNESDFPKKKDTRDGYAARCKLCCREDCHKYFIKNKESQLEKKSTLLNNKRDINRNYSYYYLKEHPCVQCGESDPAVLQFDHLRDKKRNVSQMIQRGILLVKIIEEINKCQILCANCHAKKTAKDQKWYSKIGDKLDYETICSRQE